MTPEAQPNLNQLYAEKGELVTQLEIGQGKLAQVNQQIANLLGLTPIPVNQQK